MNAKWFSLVLLIVFAAILVFVLARRPHPQVPATVAEVTTNKPAESAQATSKAASRSNVESVGASPSPTPVVESVQARMERANREGEAEIAMWQAPLLYFGKVVDESNQPIAGVGS